MIAENTKLRLESEEFLMANVLFISSNDRPVEQAISVQMHQSFLQSYREANPQDTITELNLFDAELPYYGNTMITGLFKLRQGMEPTAEEVKLAGIANFYFDQFMAADKIIFSFPLWNSTVPAPLVTYISYLAQAGKMFTYTAEGPVGMAGDKKVMLLCARGGDYSSEQMAAMEMALNLVKSAIYLWGIHNPETVVIEGHNQYPDRAKEIVADGLKETAAAGSRF
ncbi:FMN-dependent NADH-azoreductase [Paenibacillus sp. MBLB4367]|uniref:FMN-dependent NADH-azoreductase n=1 Tax=Paenibacillus sp. MBLB4367 TaxID=3384767 RepID=UPI003907F913